MPEEAEKKTGQQDAPLVSICCIAFNQEKYIRETLDSFLMQKTSFPFEVLIHDDASTDRTADIIREYAANYPRIVKPVCQTENQHSKGIAVGMPRTNAVRASSLSRLISSRDVASS